MLRAGDQIGPYELISRLGRGAFGVVWLAERRTSITTTKAALKIPLDDEIDLETIRHEANLWVQASGHPNVLPIIEANVYDNQVVIASEYAPDGSLESWLKRHGGKAPSIESAVDVLSGILAGLEHLHRRRIIHRDLKPANIIFQGETPRLADFGVSRVLKSTSQSNTTAGTPTYMAPEAFDGKRSEQTDLWSAGVILYQLLSGHLPFPQADMASLFGAIRSRNPDPLPISVPLPIQQVVTRSLNKDRTRRYKSASEMRSDLRRAVGANRRIEYAPDQATTMRAYPAGIVPPARLKFQSIKRKSRHTSFYGVTILGALLIVALLSIILAPLIFGNKEGSKDDATQTNVPMSFNSSLVSYYRMEGNSKDSKGRNNGTDNSITYNTTNGKFGQGAGFASASFSHIDLPDPGSSIRQMVSVSFWIKTTANTRSDVLDLMPASDNGDLFFAPSRTTIGKMDFCIYNGTATIAINGSKTINDGNWHHIVGMRNGGIAALYVDGNPDGTSSFFFPVDVGGSKSAMGHNRIAVSSYFNGSMDEVAIFSRVLSLTEITRLATGAPLY